MTNLGPMSWDRIRPTWRPSWGYALLFAAAALLVAAPAQAGDGGSTTVEAVALLAPLGISPFFALAGLGLADAAGVYALPSSITGFQHPALIAAMVLLGLGLHFGRSTKLTKPFAEAAGVGESLFALVIALVAAAGSSSAGPVVGPAEASVAGTLVWLTAGISALSLILVLRTALDILIWLSPFPFVDALFQLLKVILTLALVVAAAFAPWLAVAMGLALVVSTALGLSWALRTLRFGATVLWDLTLGRGATLAEAPRDEVVAQDIGPFRAFAVDLPKSRLRAPLWVELRAGRWVALAAPDAIEGRALGDAERCSFRRTWAGTELSAPGGTVLLPPRYRRITRELAAEAPGSPPAHPFRTRGGVSSGLEA